MKKTAVFLWAVLLLCAALCMPALAEGEDAPAVSPDHYGELKRIQASMDLGNGDGPADVIIGPGAVRVLQKDGDSLFIRMYVGNGAFANGWVSESKVEPMDEDAYLASLAGAEDVYHNTEGTEYFLLPITYVPVTLTPVKKSAKVENGKFKVTIEKAVPYTKDELISVPGSVLSEGSLTVLVGIAAAVVFGLGGFFIGKAAGKKKKPATAGGEDTDEE